MNGNNFKIGHRADSVMDRPKGLENGIKFAGHGFVQCFDKDGNLKWEDTFKNGVVDVGLDHILDTEFHGGSAVATWYIGLIRDDNFTALADADTMASHAGWEEADEYSETPRQEWTEGAPSSEQITNAVTVDFSMNATEVIKGMFLVSNNTKSGGSGTLWATALWSGGDQAVNNGDTLKVTYTITAADA